METIKKGLLANLFGGEGHATSCEVCGNEYEKCFEVRMGGVTHIFDSFECAIQALAPTCAHCGCRIIGHGVEVDDLFYCCGHCAGKHGMRDIGERVETERSPA